MSASLILTAVYLFVKPLYIWYDTTAMVKKFLIINLFGIFLAGCTLPFSAKNQAALKVESDPPASVYLNGNHLGQTPFYSEEIKPGEYTLRVVVENDPTKDWQTKVILNSKLVTAVNRVFGSSTDTSSDYQLMLEPLASKDTQELSILTLPDNIIVKIDGQPEGFTPISTTSLTEGSRQILLTAPGYQEMLVNADMKKGYKLILSASLARSSLPPDQLQATPSAQLTLTPQPETSTPSAKPTTKTALTPKPTQQPPSTPSNASSSADLSRPYVEILDTPTGWLRVRAEGNSVAEEIAKVYPGENYKYLDTNEAGWHQIVLTSGDEGWISAKYAKLYR